MTFLDIPDFNIPASSALNKRSLIVNADIKGTSYLESIALLPVPTIVSMYGCVWLKLPVLIVDQNVRLLTLYSQSPLARMSVGFSTSTNGTIQIHFIELLGTSGAIGFHCATDAILWDTNWHKLYFLFLPDAVNSSRLSIDDIDVPMTLLTPGAFDTHNITAVHMLGMTIAGAGAIAGTEIAMPWISGDQITELEWRALSPRFGTTYPKNCGERGELPGNCLVHCDFFQDVPKNLVNQVNFNTVGTVDYTSNVETLVKLP